MSGLTEQFVVLLMFSCFFALCEGILKVTVKTGEDVTLQCQGPRDEPITVIEWSRTDLESDDFVFYFRDNRLYEHFQLPSFRGRVELRDPEMKNGDVSVILKNVNINDNGTYECFVRTGSSGRDIEFRQSVTLKVTHLDPDGEASSITAETLSMFRPLLHLLVFIPYCISTILMVSLCPQRSTGKKPPEDDVGLDQPYDDVIADVTTEHHF